MRLIALALTGLLLAGCGTFADPTEWFGEDAADLPSPLVEVENRAQAQRLWSRDVGSGTDEQRLNLEPIVASGVLYVADADGRVLALDAQTGRNLWSVDLDLPVSGGPGVGQGMVLVGTSDGELIALGESDGALRWSAQLSSEILSVPRASDGVVVVRTNDGKLFGLEATNGNERWRYEREVPVLTLRGTGSPVVVGGAAYFGMSGGRLVALRIDTGGLLWDTSVTVPSGRSELERLADIDGDPLVFGGGVFVATYQGEVAAAEQRSGRLAWRRKLSAYSAMATDGRRLYVSDAEGVVWALDVRSGTAVWSQEALKFRRLSDAQVLGNYVVVGDFEGYLHWIERDSGELAGRSRVGSAPITTGMHVADDVLFVQGDDGDLAAFRLPQ
jgi:outer membrane protein assembly factor BamB